MTAGKPDYNRLMELGKLPKGARGNIPYLKELDDANKRIKELEMRAVLTHRHQEQQTQEVAQEEMVDVLVRRLQEVLASSLLNTLPQVLLIQEATRQEPLAHIPGLSLLQVGHSRLPLPPLVPPTSPLSLAISSQTLRVSVATLLQT